MSKNFRYNWRFNYDKKSNALLCEAFTSYKNYPSREEILSHGERLEKTSEEHINDILGTKGFDIITGFSKPQHNTTDDYLNYDIVCEHTVYLNESHMTYNAIIESFKSHRDKKGFNVKA